MAHSKPSTCGNATHAKPQVKPCIKVGDTTKVMHTANKQGYRGGTPLSLRTRRVLICRRQIGGGCSPSRSRRARTPSTKRRAKPTPSLTRLIASGKRDWTVARERVWVPLGLGGARKRGGLAPLSIKKEIPLRPTERSVVDRKGIFRHSRVREDRAPQRSEERMAGVTSRPQRMTLAAKICTLGLKLAIYPIQMLYWSFTSHLP